MTTSEADRLIVVSLLVAGGLAVVTEAAAGHVPPVRIGLGAVVSGIMLSTLAQVAPNIAGPLALLAASSAIFVYGGPAFAVLSTATAPHPTGGSPAARRNPINT